MFEANRIVSQDLTRIIAADLPWARLQNKTVLITGGAGFLGAYLVKSLLAANDKYNLNLRLLCLSRSKPTNESRLGQWVLHEKLNFIFQDVSAPLPSDIGNVHFIIHAASQASPKYFGTDPVGTLLPNTIGTCQLLDLARSQNCEGFLLFSSAEIYGTPTRPDLPIKEREMGTLDPMNVRSSYAEGKRVAETMCVAWATQYQIHANVVRPFHTYGPGMAVDDGRVFADFVADVVARRDITLTSDGEAMRAFCYVSDATIGFLTVLLKGESRTAYNVGNPLAEISIRDLANMLTTIFPERGLRTQFSPNSINQAYLKSPVSRCYPSIDRIHELGWTPVIGLREGFQRTIRSFD